MKRKLIKLLSVFLCGIMIFGLLPTTAFAGYTSWVYLPTSAGSTLQHGNIYRVSGNTSIGAGSGGNALNIASGATVVIYIPSGYTLAVYGGNGSGPRGGGAGINLPSNSTLILAGSGRLAAYGGNASNGSSGGSGGSGSLSRSGSGWMQGGSGGSGGYGGGGAGAGIGGSGGYGGAGGSGGAPQGSECYHSGGRRDGGNGYGGSSGGTGAAMGRLYALNTVSIIAYGGYSGGAGGGGGRGSDANDRGSGWKNHYTASGGSGGGGGSIGYDFGSGGYAGGGGGGGGAGGNFTDSGGHYYTTADGGSGGYGYSNGYRGGGTRAVHANYWGGYGGGSGGTGSWNGHGTIYRASGAAINGGRYGNASSTRIDNSTPSPVNYNVTLDGQGGTGGSSSFPVVYGAYLPQVTVPTKSQYSFMGYYSSPDGNGSRYYDQRGAGLFVWENTADVTLYAYWVQNQFNITFDKQTGSGGTNSAITVGSDGTLPSIDSPTKQYFTFNGYFDKAAGAGTRYYDSVGTPVLGMKTIVNRVLYASWTQNQFRVSFNRQSGTGGEDSIMTNTEGTLPAITSPTKEGGTFTGYWTQSTGGTQVYGADGTSIAGRKMSADTTLYAQWQDAQYEISYQLDGGTVASNPTTRMFSEKTVISNPVKADYSFLGWQVDNGDIRYRDLIIPSSSTVYAKNITLKAIWTKTMDTSVEIKGDVQVAKGNEKELRAGLKESFDTMVSDPNKGVTANDLTGDKGVKLILSVDKSSGLEDHELIDKIAQGSALHFYDITAKKEITMNSTVNTTELLEIPVPISVKIPLEGDLKGKTAYRVYRVHDGNAELLPTGPTSSEYYDVEDGNIVIRTRKFSTYGVIGSEKQFGAEAGDIFKGDDGDVDVQGRVIEESLALIYKIDIIWGTMKFEYSMDREWDPDTHMYTEGALNAWRHGSFDGENNRIRSINHSNGGVKLNYAVTQNDLLGVEMSLHIYNELTAVKAENFILPSAPIGSTNAELEAAVAYLFLSGSPELSWLEKNNTQGDGFTKAGVITVTVEPDPNKS